MYHSFPSELAVLIPGHMGINAAGEKLFLTFFINKYFWGVSFSQLTCSDWVLSETQILQAVFMKFKTIGILKTVTYCCWLLIGLASDKKKLPPSQRFYPLQNLKS